ncbi:MAG: hypothetical protein NC122_06780 [Faecalibacterium sp.]|nr:hypothetical protein [Ruminococcus sp.]MCM1485894.1 hypothetical protein [Faecalibacterium sp.]
MINYTNGATYQKGHIDVSSEHIPVNPAFKTFHPGEEHVFEPHTNTVTFYQVAKAFEDGTITKLDKTVISLVATFASAACTTKALLELLTLMDADANKNTLESSVKRLFRYHLVDFSRFRTPDGQQCNTRVITLTNYGSQIADELGVIHRFDHNRERRRQAETYSVKSRTETTQLICNWLKNLSIEKFSVRPVIVVDPDNHAIIRPAATISLNGDTLYFEVPRRHEGWLDDINEKLHRYELVFGGKDNVPEIVINGEDEEMNREIFNSLKGKGISSKIMYTDDLKMFGDGFRTSLYTFDSDGRMLRYRIAA